MRVVCALSGGGAKAAAHLGALRALRERGLEPAHVVGTSMGALVGAAIAAGRTPEQVRADLVGLSRHEIAAPTLKALLGLFADALFRSEPLRRVIRRLVPATRFADLTIPLTITAVDLETGALVLFGAGGREDVPLEDAIYATCALPLYFPPAVIDGRSYVDGGLRCVLPIDVAAEHRPDLIFAVDTGPSTRETPPDKPAKVPLLIRRSGQVQRVMMAAQTEALVTRWRSRPADAQPRLVLVEPAVRAESTFRLDLVPWYDREGYRAACEALSAVP